jgi:hypothetical protein
MFCGGNATAGGIPHDPKTSDDALASSSARAEVAEVALVTLKAAARLAALMAQPDREVAWNHCVNLLPGPHGLPV